VPAAQDFPIILKPNLGCPHLAVLRPPEDVVTIRPLIAMRPGEFRWPDPSRFAGGRHGYRFCLRPSFPGDAVVGEISLEPSGPPEPVAGWGHLPNILDVSDTAALLSRELHYQALGESTTYWHLPVRFRASEAACLRRVSGRPVPTLYDLFLLDPAERSLRRNPHAVQLMPAALRTPAQAAGCFRFIHLTDLHLARRNDEIIDDVVQTATAEERKALLSDGGYVNFNAHFRSFVRKANELTDEGQLDFVLATGDLVDFAHHGWSDREDNDENNWMVFRDIVTGEGAEKHRCAGSEGLRVAIFTGTGNHDWRLHPYDIAQFGMHGEFGLTAEQARRYRYNEFDPRLYPDEERDRLADQLSKGFFDEMVVDGVLASLLIKARIPFLRRLLMAVVGKWLLTPLIENPLHADPVALHYYLRHINPQLDYAFAHRGSVFCVLDGGPDVFTGRLADAHGLRGLPRLQVKDLLLGFAPDSRGLDSTRQLYNWSQLRWLEKVLACAGREGSGPIFVAVHAPPLNCGGGTSWEELARRSPMLMDRKGDVRDGTNLTYGALRHHVTDLLRVCTGADGEGHALGAGRPVAAILCGHAHRQIEFRTEAAPHGDLRIWCDRFSDDPREAQWPLVLQTGACGPRRHGAGDADPAPDPPYARLIDVGPEGPVTFEQKEFGR
jgi:3',5'-cyclic AMP phosphodiesterase CpdA